MTPLQIGFLIGESIVETPFMVSLAKNAVPQSPGRLIFREYPHKMLDMKWPASDKGFSEGVAKRNRAENQSCTAC